MRGVIGRILRKRDCGRIVFLTVRALEATVQVAATVAMPAFGDFKRLPTGTLVRVWGTLASTRKGKPTYFLERYEIVLQATQHLPDKYHGLSDGARHYRRVLDLLTSEASFEAAKRGADLVHELRSVLHARGYREVNTGILQRRFEGGLARPFETILQANGMPYYLSLTSELKLKRLITAGFERVSEITQSFRNEGLGKYHSPEFTLLEAYGIDQTLDDIMVLTESLLGAAARVAGCEVSRVVHLSFADAYSQYVDTQPASLARLAELYPGKFVSGMSYFTCVMKVLETLIGPSLMEPTFITELPAGLSPLVKKTGENSSITQRAFLFVKGLFIADLYVDENDPTILESELRTQAADQGTEINEEYLEVVRIGIPPTAGLGLGVNRLQMCFLPDTLPHHIRETILFPLG